MIVFRHFEGGHVPTYEGGNVVDRAKEAIILHTVALVNRATARDLSIDSIRASALRLHDWFCAKKKTIFYESGHPYNVGWEKRAAFVKLDYMRVAGSIIMHNADTEFV